MRFINQPELKNSVMIAAWKGWPDAGYAGTLALTVIIDQLDAKPLTNLERDRFFQFTETRPNVHKSGGKRKIIWPEGRFFYREATSARQHDLALFIGDEPHLKWGAYSDWFRQVAGFCDTQLLVTVGAYLDAVPHTLAPQVALSANASPLGRRFRNLDFPESTYEGPVAIGSIIADEFLSGEIPCVSVWGRSPNYLNQLNPPLAAAIIEKLNPFVRRDIDTDALWKARENFLKEAEEHIKKSGSGLRNYIKMLEKRFDEGDDALIKDVEDYLRFRDDNESDK